MKIVEKILKGANARSCVVIVAADL